MAFQIKEGTSDEKLMSTKAGGTQKCVNVCSRKTFICVKCFFASSQWDMRRLIAKIPEKVIYIDILYRYNM